MCSDSRLFVCQFQGDFEVKDSRMLEYLKAAQSLQAQFRIVKVTRIS